jgi:hypothetical protein
MLEDVDEEDLGEIPFDLVPYPYNRVPNSFGQDKPEYPELRKLLMLTLDILDRGCGVLLPYAPKGKLVYYDVASIDIEPDSAILRVSDWQGANEIMNFLTNAHLIRWDEDTEAYELVKRVRESVEEDEGPSEIPYELQPYPFNQIPRDIAEHFRNEIVPVLEVLRSPYGELRVHWKKGGDWAVDYLDLLNFGSDGLLLSKEKIDYYPTRLFRFLNDTLKLLKWDQGASNDRDGYVYRLKKQAMTEAARERSVVARVLNDPAEQDALIKNAIENAKRPTRRR